MIIKHCARSSSVTRQVTLKMPKIDRKCQNSNATFSVIVKQCVIVWRVLLIILLEKHSLRSRFLRPNDDVERCNKDLKYLHSFFMLLCCVITTTQHSFTSSLPLATYLDLAQLNQKGKERRGSSPPLLRVINIFPSNESRMFCRDVVWCAPKVRSFLEDFQTSNCRLVVIQRFLLAQSDTN